MRQYRALIRSELGCIFGTAVLGVFSSFSMVFAGYSLSFLFTAYETKGDKGSALFLTGLLVTAIWLAAMLLYYLALLAKAKMQQRVKNALRAMIGQKIGRLPYSDYASKDSGHYVSWLTNDVESLYQQSFGVLLTGIEDMATAIFSLGALCLLSPYLGLAALVLLVAISVLPQLANKRLQRANAHRSAALERSTEAYKDVIMGSSVFFMSNLRQRICQRIAATSEKAEKVEFRYRRLNDSVQVFIATVSMLGQIILLLVTLLTAAFEAAPPGAALSVGNLAGSFFNGAGSLVRSFLTLKASRFLWEKFAPRSRQTKEADREVSNLAEIRLEHVSFGYEDRKILENKSCVFLRGGKYAITGESGSGKTTLVKILLGQLPGYTGNVWYGELEQRNARIDSLYDRIAYVEQQVYLFQDTLRSNITLGRSYSDAQIMDTIEKCRLKQWVASLPHGLDTPILENGKNLSGGQRQRIALARGLIRKVEYIVLDEGTSALDETNALEIEKDILDMPELGVILITHHLNDSIRKRLTGVVALSA